MTRQYHVYEDWTLEDTPRCFYVGKGDDDRLAKLKRQNKRHSDVTQTLGQRRVVVFSTFNENEALDRERTLIQERHVHPRDPEYNGIGCNRTLGGQGNSGRIVTDETRRKISEAKKGKTPNKVWTQAERVATSRRMSELHKGKKLSDEHVEVLRSRMTDPNLKSEMIEKVGDALRKKYQDDPEFYQRVVETRARGEASPTSKFTTEQVIVLRQEWDALDRTIRGTLKEFCLRWAEHYHVTSQAIRMIALRKNWKHVL